MGAGAGKGTAQEKAKDVAQKEIERIEKQNAQIQQRAQERKEQEAAASIQNKEEATIPQSALVIQEVPGEEEEDLRNSWSSAPEEAPAIPQAAVALLGSRGNRSRGTYPPRSGAGR